MIRTELVDIVAKEFPDLGGDDVDRMVKLFFNEISAHLRAGGRVELRGFGVFTVRDRKARKGRNPRTSTPVAVPPKRVPFFKPGRDILRRLNSEKS